MRAFGVGRPRAAQIVGGRRAAAARRPSGANPRPCAAPRPSGSIPRPCAALRPNDAQGGRRRAPHRHSDAGVRRLLSNAESRSSRHTDVAGLLAALAVAGATTGTFLDGIHGKVGLLTYTAAPLTIGGLHTSAWVPPLLATFYATFGALLLAADRAAAAAGDAATIGELRRARLSRMALSFAALAGMLEVSAVMFRDGAPFDTISATLAALAAANYLIFDGTKQGLALAAACAVAAPAAEVGLNSGLGLHLWDYGAAGNLYGVPSFTPFCYFMYCPALSCLTRFCGRSWRSSMCVCVASTWLFPPVPALLFVVDLVTCLRALQGNT